jgi:tetratricopeptide (TPR) repeat protein
MSHPVLTRFVGRAQELGLLRDRLDLALEGRGNVVFLSAEAGAGKSTLVDRFLGEVPERSSDCLVVRATCSEQYGAGEPFQPFVEAFRHLSARMEGGRGRSFRELAGEIAPFWVAAIPVAGEALAAGMATASELKRTAGKGRSLKELARDIAPLWVAAIPVAGEALAAGMATASELRSTFEGGGGQAPPSEEALFFQYTELFLAASDERPIVLFIDDLHWADRATVSLLTHLGRQIANRRVLILGSYRPVDIDVSDHTMAEARHELERQGVAEELVVGPLGKEALGGLVESRAGVPATRRLLDWLEQHGGTNALFFEELLDWLQHQGFARQQYGELDLVRVPEDVDIPRTAESTIAKRLDRLDEETRRLLEYASVDGTEFDSVSLSRLLDMEKAALEAALEPLMRVHRLIQLKETWDRPDADSVCVYRFSHSLIQGVLHDGLYGKRRILLHRRMGEILEEIWGPQAASVAHKLAIHFEEGRKRDKAFDYAIEAAGRARQVYAHWDALDQIERALRSAETDDQRSLALQQLGEAHLAIGRYTEAIDALDQALERVDGNPRRALAIRHQRLVAQRDQGTRPVGELLEEMQSLRELAGRMGDRAEQCRIIWHLINLPGTTESLDVVLAEEALEAAEELGDPWLLARGRGVLGLALVFDGRPAEAVPRLEEAREMWAKLGDRGREAGCRGNLALAHVFLGDYPRAAAELEAAAAAFDEIVDPDHSAAARTNLARVLKIMGEYGPAEEALLRALQIGERLSSPATMLSPLFNLAELCQDREQWEQAEAWWTEMLARATESGYVTRQVIAYCGIGVARLCQGNLEGALEAERAARELVGADQEVWDESREALARLSARMAAAAGEWEGAVALMERLVQGDGDGDPYTSAVYQVEAAEIMKDVEPRRALELAREASAVLRRIGARPMLRRAEAVLAGQGVP